MYKAQSQFSYTKRTISKKNGKKRNIYIPNIELKTFLKALLPQLNEIYINNKSYDLDHAFVKNRNCVSNAYEHISNRYVLSIDIENFFESIPKFLLEKYVPQYLLEYTLINNQIIQGYPTSPCLANIAMIDVDNLILSTINSEEIIYTRYADDLTFSFNKKDYEKKVLNNTIKCLRKFGLKINSRKTKFQDKANGRAIITGLGVSNDDVHSSRKTLKKLRAAQHQKNLLSEKGLREWSLCKLPNINT